MTTTTLSDVELLHQARGGDEAAFTELYVRHHAAALRLASTYRRLGDPEDLVNESFEKVLGALRRGGGPTEAFRAYLFVTLRRLASDQAERPREDPLDDVPEPVAAEAVDGSSMADRAIISRAFESLPERWQAVLWHAAIEGRQPRELGPVLGVSANAAAALSYRAREKLRQAYLQAHLQASPHPECEPHRSRLGAYVRDALTPRDQQATQHHIEACESCQALVVELTEVNRLLVRSVLPLFLLGGSVGTATIVGGTVTAAGTASAGAGAAAVGAGAAASGGGTGGSVVSGAGSLVRRARHLVSSPGGVVATAGVLVGLTVAALTLIGDHDSPGPGPGAAPERPAEVAPDRPPAAPAEPAPAPEDEPDRLPDLPSDVDEPSAPPPSPTPRPRVAPPAAAPPVAAPAPPTLPTVPPELPPELPRWGFAGPSAWHPTRVGRGSLAVTMGQPAAVANLRSTGLPAGSARSGGAGASGGQEATAPSRLLRIELTERATVPRHELDPSCAPGASARTIECVLPTLAPGATTSIEVPVDVAGPGQSATVTLLRGTTVDETQTITLARYEEGLRLVPPTWERYRAGHHGFPFGTLTVGAGLDGPRSLPGVAITVRLSGDAGFVPGLLGLMPLPGGCTAPGWAPHPGGLPWGLAQPPLQGGDLPATVVCALDDLGSAAPTLRELSALVRPWYCDGDGVDEPPIATVTLTLEDPASGGGPPAVHVIEERTVALDLEGG